MTYHNQLRSVRDQTSSSNIFRGGFRGTWTALLIAIGCLAGFTPVAAQTLANWTFDGPVANRANPSFVAPNVTASVFSGGPGIGTIQFIGAGARANGWTTGTLDTDDYFEISVAPTVGANLLVTELQFGERRTGNSILDYEVRWSKDPFFGTFTTIAAVTVPDTPSERTGDITGLNITVLEGETLYFRWYGFNAESSAANQNWRINDQSLAVIGTTSACGVTDLGPVVLNCQSTSPLANTDQMTLSIPYTGRDPMATVSASIVSGGPLTVGGDDPATDTDGTIVISGSNLVEGSEYLVEINGGGCTWSLTAVIPANFCRQDCAIVPGLPIIDCQATTNGPDPVDFIIPYFGIQPGATITVTPAVTIGGDDPALVANGSIEVSGAVEGVTYQVTITDGSTCITSFAVTLPDQLCIAKNNRPFLSEIHYDNDLDDVNEFIEVAVPTTGIYSILPLSSIQVYLYNGSTGNFYFFESVDRMVPGMPSQGYQYYVWYPPNIQNGDPDGFALVANGIVLEFFSYDKFGTRTITGNDGPAFGRVSEDMVVFETGKEAPGLSLQRTGTCAAANVDCPDGLFWTGPSPESPGKANANQLLPVTLLSFRATPDRTGVFLDWMTSNEIDNDFFAIERSADGRAWSTLGKVAGAGTTDATSTYRYVDAEPLPGRSYYRLQQVDFDGTTEYFGPVAVDFAGSGKAPLSVYPNPVAADHVILEGVLNEGGKLHLLDVTGRVLRAWSLAERELRREVPLAGLPAGVYVLRLTEGDRVRTVRLVRE